MTLGNFLDRKIVRRNRAIYFSLFALGLLVASSFGVLPILGTVFVFSYAGIAFAESIDFEHEIPSLFVGTILWILLYYLFHHGYISIVHEVDHHIDIVAGGTEEALEILGSTLGHHTWKISEILLFLIGAMTIVEIVELHRGFDLIKQWIKTKDKTKLLWITGIAAFILSAIIDNLTATIVLATVLKKLIPHRETRIWFLSMAVIAANAGGAWSPVGDLTTTMLWIAGKVSTGGLISQVFFASFVCFAVPYAIASFMKVFKGNLEEDDNNTEDTSELLLLSSKKMLFIGLGSIGLVPVIKSLLHVPPFMAMLFALVIVWTASTLIHPEEEFSEESKDRYSTHHALSRVHWASVLFFAGILFAVAAFETIALGNVNVLRALAELIQEAIPNTNVVVLIMGAISSIIDNVPLVAAGLGMFEGPQDSVVWQFLAYSAGTGGSMLIIGSAAGVAAMGQDQIDFGWYMKNIGWLAAIGFLAGAGAFFLF